MRLFRLFRKAKNRRNRRSPSYRATRMLRAEALERRELLSISVVGDELRILGTSGNDCASVAQRSLEQEQWDSHGHRVPVQGPDKYLEVTMNGETRQFFYDFPGGPDFYKIVFRGYGGDDVFHNYTDIPSDAYGGFGRDTLYGGSNGDLLVGGAGVDHLYGGRGADRLCANELPGTWTVATGGYTAPDYEVVSDSIVDPNPGCGTLDGVVYCVDHLGYTDALVHDYLYGGYGDDTLYGGPYNDRMWGEGGSDELFGYSGDDRLYGGEGADTLHGGRGNDRLAGEADSDDLRGDEGDDRLFGGEGRDALEGGEGNDSLLGESGTDTLRGGPGSDHLMGGEGSDALFGGEGSDGLFGGADSVRDVLRGDESGSGVWAADRFLTRTGDVIGDLCPSDVEIRFPDESDPRAWRSGTEPWTDREVYWIDRAFEQLQDRAQSTAVLKDTHGNGPIEFVKTFQSQWNEFADDAGRWHTVILIEDWTEDVWLEDLWFDNQGAQRETIHELGHSWGEHGDCGETPAHPAGFEYWEPFVALHNESDPDDPEYLRDFVSDYGSGHAREDWSTCWEVTFGYRLIDYNTDPSERLQQKLAIVDEFFARLRPRSSNMMSLAVRSVPFAEAESAKKKTQSMLLVSDLLDKLYAER